MFRLRRVLNFLISHFLFLISYCINLSQNAKATITLSALNDVDSVSLIPYLYPMKILLRLILPCLLTTSCKNNQSDKTIATINYNFQGCFGGGKSRIVIYKHEQDTMASLQEDSAMIIKAKLSRDQLDSFRIFLNELRTLDENGFCTTISHYEVSMGNETIRKTNNGCSWDGFSMLSGCLFRNAYYPVSAQ